MSDNHGVIIMVSLKKYIPCKCGANNSFDFSSDMQVEDITVNARCSACGASIAISVSALLASPTSSPLQPSPSDPSTPAATLVQAHDEAETKANVEQAVRDLFR
ncbi:MAG: hypothetical protein NT051_02770 [Candidatus Micrarchaeota archaeon]|nr:hypothetical protein [Candidatus Micrarchaeota archaeon]